MNYLNKLLIDARVKTAIERTKRVRIGILGESVASKLANGRARVTKSISKGIDLLK